MPRSTSWVTYIFLAIHAQTLDYFYNLFIAPVKLFEFFVEFFLVANVIVLSNCVVQPKILDLLADSTEDLISAIVEALSLADSIGAVPTTCRLAWISHDD